MKLYCIKNHVSNSTETTDAPWKHSWKAYPKMTKTAWRDWCKNPETDHCFISGMVGLNPNLRVNKTENPVVRQVAALVDLDCLPETSLAFPEGKAPTWAARTFGGGYRLLYEFEAPVNFGQLPGLVDKWLDVLIKKLALKKLPGFDENVFRNQTIYLEVGREWERVDGAEPLDKARLEKWWEEASRRFDFTRGNVAVPMEKVRATLEARYPGAWDGGWQSFEVGARGCRFWDGGDASSVIVRETGLQCFTGHRGFLPWSSPELLGSAAVAKHYESKIGEATDGVYYDGKHYWQEGSQGWQPLKRVNVTDMLECAGLCPTRKDGEPSEVTQALERIRAQHVVAQAVPLFYRPPGELWGGNQRLLNITRIKSLTPAPEGSVTEWSEGFPWLAAFLDEWLEEEPLQWFLAHLKHAYECAHYQRPSRGLGVIIAGPVGAGKTFFTSAVIGRLLGRAIDASSYLVDGEPYNARIVESPVWTLDDIADSGKWYQNSRFSKLLKRVLANDSIPYRRMYSETGDVIWKGRIYMTCNDDEESIRALPRTDINIMDKLLLIRSREVVREKWISDEALNKELPFFARCLLDMETPAEMVGDRFGVKPYHDESLVEMMDSINPAAIKREVFDRWRSEAIKGGEREASTVEIYDEIMNMDSAAAAKEFRNAQSLGWFLSTLAKAGESGIKKRRTKTGMKYRIQAIS